MAHVMTNPELCLGLMFEAASREFQHYNTSEFNDDVSPPQFENR